MRSRRSASGGCIVQRGYLFRNQTNKKYEYWRNEQYTRHIRELTGLNIEVQISSQAKKKEQQADRQEQPHWRK